MSFKVKTVSKIKTAIIYAEAMYDSAMQTNHLDALYNDALQFAAMSDESLQSIAAVNSPLVAVTDKIKIVEDLSAKLGLSQNMLNTLKLLAENNKLNFLPEICRQYIRIYQEKHNIAEIEVTTVVPLTETQNKKLQEKLKAIFNKEIIIDYIINPNIIGGLIIRYGTNFIDNSIQQKLNALEQLMKGTK